MTLTQGLLVLAAAVLAGLAGHGLWTTWRARPRQADAAMRRTEPYLGERAEPTLEVGAPEAGGERPGRSIVGSRLRAASPIDPLIDAVAEISIDAPITAEAALAALPASRRAGSKPMFVEGLNTETGQWEPPQHGQRYGAFQSAVQLANRGGALNEIEYSEFVQKTQRFADAIGGTPDFADMGETVARARELDDFARVHDAQLAVHIRARSTAWTVAYLLQMARRHGAVEAALPGSLVLPGEEADGPPLALVTFDGRAAMAEDPDASALRECTVTLDVPQSLESAEPFPRWQQLATELARDLDGLLVDDEGQPVGLHQFAAIHRDLQRLYSALASRELTAGSPVARRLFS